jgi:hypothetical protein
MILPPAAPRQPIERRHDQGLDFTVDNRLDGTFQLGKPDVLAARDALVVELAARLDLEAAQHSRSPVDPVVDLRAFLDPAGLSEGVAAVRRRPSLVRVLAL